MVVEAQDHKIGNENMIRFIASEQKTVSTTGAGFGAGGGSKTGPVARRLLRAASRGTSTVEKCSSTAAETQNSGTWSEWGR